jgi:V/A-type H+-transporting ATPase subunit D
MTLRVPPGRSGRSWLLRRLDIAHVGADVLEEKRRMLLQRRLQLEQEAENERAEWLQLAGTAAELGRRALVLSGARRLRLTTFYSRGPAEVVVASRNLLGVVVPDHVDLRLPEPVDLAPLGASMPLVLAADAHGCALASGAACARAEQALRLVDAELARTARRLRALEKRWIPLHERALARLELSLEEAEREDAARRRQGRELNRLRVPG